MKVVWTLLREKLLSASCHSSATERADIASQAEIGSIFLGPRLLTGMPER